MQRFVKTLLLVYCFAFSKVNFSQDIRAGWIDYKWLGGYTYSLTATLIFDSAAFSTHTIELNGNFAPLTSSLTSPGQVKISTYSIVDTYHGPGSYINWCDANKRLANIKNFPFSQTKSLYLSTYVPINSFLAPNNSPVVTIFPNVRTSIGNLVNYNPGMYDPDGDSLSYRLDNCWSNPTSSYYIPANANISFFGDFTYQADTVGLYAFNIEVKEWRKDINGNWQSINEIPIDFIVEVVSTSGVQEFEKKDSFSIFPNPASSALTIKTNSKINSPIEITNCLGEVVFKQPFSETINVSSLSSGYYFVKVNGSHSKFVKE